MDKKIKNVMNELDNAISMEFPLRGEWMPLNSPGTKIPSHGSDHLGQRYAIDLLQNNWRKKGINFCDATDFRYFLFGVPLNKFFCYGQNIYAPCDGKIVECKDGIKDRQHLHLLADILISLKIGFFDVKKNLHKGTGNYIILECKNNTFAFFAHMKKDSIKVSIGENIKKGQILGQVGHTGSSICPHLHFHLMDNINLWEAKGIPFVFEKYEVYKNDTWENVYNCIPKSKERIRFNG